MSSTTAPQPGTTGTQAPPSPNGSAAPQPAPAAPVVPPMPSEAHPAERHAAAKGASADGSGTYLRRITRRITRRP